jgi:hypothetical protein
MEDEAHMGTAHSLLSWHTRHQLTGEFRFQEEVSQPSQPPIGFFFSLRQPVFFPSPLATTNEHIMLNTTHQMHGQEREEEARKK